MHKKLLKHCKQQKFSETYYMKITQLQGSGAWPCAGLSLLKVKESLLVIQMVQTLHTPAKILYVCIHKNVLTIL